MATKFRTRRHPRRFFARGQCNDAGAHGDQSNVFERFMDRSTNSLLIYFATARRQLRLQCYVRHYFWTLTIILFSAMATRRMDRRSACAIWERFENSLRMSLATHCNVALKREAFHDFDARRLLDNSIECHRGTRNMLIDIAGDKGAFMEAVRKNPHGGSVRLAKENNRDTCRG